MPETVGSFVLTGADDDVTLPVASDCTTLEPAPFVAVTWTRRVEPTSSEVIARVAPVAPGTSEQLAPASLQRRHWYANVIGASPDQEPELAVSVAPSSGVPVMAGAAVFAGGVAVERACAEPLVKTVDTASVAATRPAPQRRYEALKVAAPRC